ncbi:hypothetical protein CA51_11250 [Rosistilla oblonga]|uniref:Uncharacterized protein n=1 Tax=Rosistilla oblonga TaxID=2527990 RepID=A0A518IPZ4_9BACT|nr:hypothetical protein [Rosistilla oblonga]QDV11263.1 hypothetical protein CA51_11250 [Rosistilla oblonga]QDV55169.1 hypothetical protein Mal33_11390 [Rosistilla oblonga]
MTDSNDEETSDAWKQFEQSWRRGNPLNLWEAISTVSPVYRRDLAVEFAMIDLEWRWRLNIDNEPRDTRHYAGMLTALQLDAEHYVSMLEHEFIVRSQWGDRPTIDEMLDGFPSAGELHSVLETALDENFPVFCFLKKEDERLLEHRVKLVTSFGRQTADDADGKYSISFDKASTRCVIADANETAIAESHLEIKRIGADRILAEIHAPNTNCLAADQPLLPHQPSELRLPLKLQLENHQIFFDCGF